MMSSTELTMCKLEQFDYLDKLDLNNDGLFRQNRIEIAQRLFACMCDLVALLRIAAFRERAVVVLKKWTVFFSTPLRDTPADSLFAALTLLYVVWRHTHHSITMM